MSITSTSASLSIHAAFMGLLLLLSTRPLPQGDPPRDSPFFVPLDLIRAPRTLQPIGGGGSGAEMPLPAAQGMLPPAATKVFVPPLQVRSNEQPILELPPAIDIPPETPNVKLANWGDPLARVGAFSNGPGRGGSIGDGDGGGLGGQRGNHYGPGDGGRGFPGVRTIGRGVTAPKLIYKIEPEYSEEARKAKYQGSVTLRVIVDEQGGVRHIEVSRPLGLGLDEKAVDAVRKWRFQPGRQDGKAVPVWAVVEVFFRLL